MAGIEVEGPDGRIHQFASGTPHAVINQQLERVYGGSAGQPAASPMGGLVAPSDPQPRSGAATPMGGAMAPGSRVVAPYQSNEDWANIGLAVALGDKNKGVITAIQNTPGHAARMEYEKKLADTNATRAAQQIASKSLLDQLDKLQLASNRAGNDVLSKSIGPNYGEEKGAAKPERGFLGNLGHDVQQMWMGATSNRNNRAVAYGLDTGSPNYVATQASQYGNPDYDPSMPEKLGKDGKPIEPNAYDKAVRLNTEMHHFKKGIATLFKTIPGGGKAGGTDQAQATLEEMVQAAINAPDAETHFKILHDAKNFIRAFGGHPNLPEQESHVPEGFGHERTAAEAQLKRGQTYMHNGQPWTYKGGPAGDPNSWGPATEGKPK